MLEIFFAVVLVVIVPPLLYYAHRRAKEQFAAIHRQFAEEGYVIEEAHRKNIGPVTRVWSRFAQPVPLYLQVENQDTVGVWAGRIGIADLKVGDAPFDAAFTVRTNHPELAKLALGPEVRSALLKEENVQFKTGSITSLLRAPEYFPEIKTDRNVREYWMISQYGKMDGATAERLRSLGLSIAASVEQACQQLPVQDSCRTGAYENL